MWIARCIMCITLYETVVRSLTENPSTVSSDEKLFAEEIMLKLVAVMIDSLSWFKLCSSKSRVFWRIDVCSVSSVPVITEKLSSSIWAFVTTVLLDWDFFWFFKFKLLFSSILLAIVRTKTLRKTQWNFVPLHLVNWSIDSFLKNCSSWTVSWLHSSKKGALP